MFEIIEITDKDKYNPLLISKQASFVQAWFYGKWQEMAGRKVRRFVIRESFKIVGFFQAIKYSLPFGQSFLYIPHLVLQNIFLKDFRRELFKIGKEEDASFVRFDSYFHSFNNGSIENLEKFFKKVPASAYHSFYFQPKFEWLLDIDKPEPELLSYMHSKTRYNIHLAENRGVSVKVISGNFSGYFEDFYELMEETARRNDFNLHPKIYYQNIFFDCERNNNAFLAVAEHNDKILVINLILIFGEVAYFVFGGSSDEFKNLMAPHLAHWQGIVAAKNRGCKIYNFGGVDSDGRPEASGWEGISRFKKGFGGRLLEYPDSYDLILSSFWHFLYGFAKSIRQTLYKRG